MPPRSTTDFIDRLPQAFRDWLDGRKVEEVECITADIAGVSRGKAMPAAKFAKEDRLFLPASIFYQTISGDWVNMQMENQWTESDMVLRPDWGAATATPWAEDVTLQIIHDCVDLSGAPVPVAPRNVLKRVVEAYRERGLEADRCARDRILPREARTSDPDYQLEPPIGRSGRADRGRAELFDRRRQRVRRR
jgi:glutamine synthetase